MSLLKRFWNVVGPNNALLILAVLFAYTLPTVIVNSIGNIGGEWIWTGTLALLTGLTFLVWNHRVTRALKASSYGQACTASVARRKGLVIVVGLDSAALDSEASRLLQEASKLSYVAFLGTPQTEHSGVVATLQRDVFPRLSSSIPKDHIRVWEQAGSQDLEGFEEACDEALSWLERRGLDANEIVVDISAGRRPMHLGALLAAERHTVEVQYLAAAWDHISHQPLPDSENFRVVRQYYPDPE